MTFAASRSAQKREERAAARQRRYAIEDAVRRERKETYLAFLNAVGAVEAVARDRCRPGRVPVDARDVTEAFMTVVRYENEVHIVGGDEVKRRARDLFTSAAAIAQSAASSTPQLELIDAKAELALTNAIADELRLTP